MSEAASLLRSTSLSVTQVAAEVGITDSAHFARQFKKANQLTPSEYRKAVRGKMFPPIEGCLFIETQVPLWLNRSPYLIALESCLMSEEIYIVSGARTPMWWAYGRPRCRHRPATR